MRGTARFAGETAAQYVDRLVSELEDAQRRLDRMDRAETAERINRNREKDTAERERDFLREQLTELQQQITSPSAPRRKSQMARLLAGLLRGEDWRNGTWR